MDGHQQSFYVQPYVTILLKEIQVTSSWGMVVAVLVVILLTSMYEGFKCLRLHVSEHGGPRWNGIPCLSKRHAMQTLLFGFEMTLGYMLMLTVMTFNVWLMVAVVVGSGAGHLLCKIFSRHRYAARADDADIPGMGLNVKSLSDRGTKGKQQNTTIRQRKGLPEEPEVEQLTSL